jgi:hypothetical protein
VLSVTTGLSLNIFLATFVAGAFLFAWLGLGFGTLLSLGSSAAVFRSVFRITFGSIGTAGFRIGLLAFGFAGFLVVGFGLAFFLGGILGVLRLAAGTLVLGLRGILLLARVVFTLVGVVLFFRWIVLIGA